MRPGPRNLITDVAGLRVGNAQDPAINTGVSCLVADAPFACGVDVRGGAPGTREVALLEPDKLVSGVDALVLSGGSAYGLASAQGVMDGLRALGRGFVVGDAVIPLVPAAIVFDLQNGGAKDWTQNPYPALGEQALANAAEMFDLGSAGAGTGATTPRVKGGLGSASTVLESGHTVGALVVANPIGDPLMPESRHFWAWADEMEGEFGGMGPPAAVPRPVDWRDTKVGHRSPGGNTVIAVVATDADLDKGGLKRLAVAAHDGIARAVQPSHTPFDGDLIFSVSTGARPVDAAGLDLLTLGHAAAVTLSRAIARGVYLADSAEADLWPAYRSLS